MHKLAIFCAIIFFVLWGINHFSHGVASSDTTPYTSQMIPATWLHDHPANLQTLLHVCHAHPPKNGSNPAYTGNCQRAETTVLQ